MDGNYRIVYTGNKRNLHTDIDVTPRGAVWITPLTRGLRRMVSKKKQVRDSLPVPEERAAGAEIEGNDGGRLDQEPGGKDGIAMRPRKDAHRRPESHRELGHAIFDAADPVRAGKELLQPGEERADPTKLNALKTFAAWSFGNPDAEGQRKPPRIIWDIPGPPYEPVDPVETETQKLEGDDE
jgi:hypothetical protein